MLPDSEGRGGEGVKAEVSSAVVGGGYAEVAGRGSGGSRSASLQGDRLAAWAEGGGRREALLDVLPDQRGAEPVYGTLKRLEGGARFGPLFGVLTNEVRIGSDGRVLLCGGGSGYAVSGHE